MADSAFIRATTAQKDVEIFDIEQLVPEKDTSSMQASFNARMKAIIETEHDNSEQHDEEENEAS